MNFKQFLKNNESVFGNTTPGIYTHTGYDDPIRNAFRQSPGNVVKITNYEPIEKIKIKKKKKKKWF
jgi:hypothetical protein